MAVSDGGAAALSGVISDAQVPPQSPPRLLSPTMWPGRGKLGFIFLGRAFDQLLQLRCATSLLDLQTPGQEISGSGEVFTEFVEALQSGVLATVRLDPHSGTTDAIQASRWSSEYADILLGHCVCSWGALAGLPPAQARYGSRDAAGDLGDIYVTSESLDKLLGGAPVDPTCVGTINYIPPFITLMLEAVEHFSISDLKFPKKDALKAYFINKTLPDGTPLTGTQVEYLATFCRPAGAMRGGQKRMG